MNFFYNLKRRNPNVYALIISVLTAIWFNGVSSMINIIVPDRGVYISLFMLIIPLILFLMDDGSLEELNPNNNIYPINTNLASQTQTRWEGYTGYNGATANGMLRK